MVFHLWPTSSEHVFLTAQYGQQLLSWTLARERGNGSGMLGYMLFLSQLAWIGLILQSYTKSCI